MYSYYYLGLGVVFGRGSSSVHLIRGAEPNGRPLGLPAVISIKKSACLALAGTARTVGVGGWSGEGMISIPSSSFPGGNSITRLITSCVCRNGQQLPTLANGCARVRPDRWNLAPAGTAAAAANAIEKERERNLLYIFFFSSTRVSVVFFFLFVFFFLLSRPFIEM